jgi:PPP family 3-phenylpropionic acid transporter
LFYYSALAALFPFLVLYYDRLGFTGTQIGLLRGISPLITLLAAPLWGALSDATQQHKRFLLAAIAGTILSVYALSRTAQFGWLVVIVIAYAFFGAPIIPLMDNSVLHILQGERDKYGRQRMWGAVGWGLASPLVGYLSERSGQHWFFYGYIICMVCAWVVGSGMPISKESIRPRFWHDLRSLLGNRKWIIFLLSILLGSLPLSISNTYLFLYLKELGASETLMGLSLTAATISELPMWFYSNAMLRKLRPKGMLTVAIIASVIQAFGYTLLPIPWLVLVFQLLHGMAFSAMWSAGVAYANEISTEATQATAQGMFGGVTMGLRTALGTLIGGVFYDQAGAVMTFRLGGIIAIAGLILFVVNSGVGSRKSEVRG